MGLFKRKEKRAGDGMAGVSDNLLTALIGGSSEVTKSEAIQIPTVAACVNLIADRISALPIKLYRQEGKEVTEITEDKRLDMLNHDTGDTINATEMKKLWIRDYFLGKGSYTYIERNLFNEPMGLLYVDESRLAVAPGADPIHKTYSIQVNGRVYFPYQFLKILRNSKGFGTGTSIISEDPLALAIYYNTMKYENATIRKGGNKKGYILSKNKLTQDVLDKVKEAWQKLYSNSYDIKDNAVVLNDGLDFKESSATSVELQLNENKRTNADEICKLFCMPADVLNGKANEAMISQFVQNCLMPLINTIESALDSDLLTESEKAGHYYWAFDTSELTRGDFVSRMNGYATALQNNIYQLDEIREKEDLPPLGFNFIKLGLDAVLVDPKTREIYTPNTGRLEKMNASGHLTDDDLTNNDIRAIIEERFNDNHDPKSGRFTSGSSKMSAPGQKPPDFSKYTVNDDPASVQNVKKQMCEQLGISEDDIDLSGIRNAEVLQPFADSLKVIKDETGMNFPSIVATEVFQGDPCCIAAYNRGENRLYISSKFFNSKDATINTLSEWANKGILPSQARTIEFLAEHEAAHIRIPLNLMHTDEAVRIWRKRKSSNLNDTDIHEYFADSAAIYRIGKNVDSNTKKAAEYLISGGVIL